MGFYFFILFVFVESVFAQDQKANTPQMQISPIDPKKSAPPSGVLDKTHTIVSSRLSGLANKLDSFFGEKRADDELNRSSLRMSYAYQIRQEQVPVKNFQFRFNLRLPHLEEKFKFSVKKNDNTAPTTSNDPLVLPEEVKEEEKEPWRFRADTGINVGYPPIFFTRARLRKNWEIPIFIQRFSVEGGWLSNQGFFQDLTLFHDYDISNHLLFRIVNEQNWQIVVKRFTTSHGPSIINNLSDDDAISYNLRVQSTVVDHVWYANNYSATITYRRNLRDQWLFGELTPGLDFPKTREFRRSPSIMFKLETLFGPR